MLLLCVQSKHSEIWMESISVSQSHTNGCQHLARVILPVLCVVSAKKCSDLKLKRKRKDQIKQANQRPVHMFVAPFSVWKRFWWLRWWQEVGNSAWTTHEIHPRCDHMARPEPTRSQRLRHSCLKSGFWICRTPVMQQKATAWMLCAGTWEMNEYKLLSPLAYTRNKHGSFFSELTHRAFCNSVQLPSCWHERNLH